MKKKLLTCIFAVTISAMMLAGCGDNANTVKEPTTTQTPTSTLAPTQPEVTEAPETTDVPEVTETPEVTEVPGTSPELTPEVTETPEIPSDIEVSNDLFIKSVKDLTDTQKTMDTSIVHKSSELDTTKFDFTTYDDWDEEKTVNLVTDPSLSLGWLATADGTEIYTFVDAYNTLVALFGTVPNEIWSTPGQTTFKCTWVVDEYKNITLTGGVTCEEFVLDVSTSDKPYSTGYYDMYDDMY